MPDDNKQKPTSEQERTLEERVNRLESRVGMGYRRKGCLTDSAQIERHEGRLEDLEGALATYQIEKGSTPEPDPFDGQQWDSDKRCWVREPDIERLAEVARDEFIDGWHGDPSMVYAQPLWMRTVRAILKELGHEGEEPKRFPCSAHSQHSDACRSADGPVECWARPEDAHKCRFFCYWGDDPSEPDPLTDISIAEAMAQEERDIRSGKVKIIGTEGPPSEPDNKDSNHQGEE